MTTAGLELYRYEDTLFGPEAKCLTTPHTPIVCRPERGLRKAETKSSLLREHPERGLRKAETKSSLLREHPEKGTSRK
ncbi:hypothetical protein BgiBS90_017781, partial [Biomphalaria glabrata]